MSSDQEPSQLVSSSSHEQSSRAKATANAEPPSSSRQKTNASRRDLITECSKAYVPREANISSYSSEPHSKPMVSKLDDGNAQMAGKLDTSRSHKLRKLRQSRAAKPGGQGHKNYTGKPLTKSRKSHKSSKVRKQNPQTASLAEFNPQLRKKEASRTLFTTLFSMNEDKSENESLSGDDEDDEDMEAHRRKVKSAAMDTIPVYRDKVEIFSPTPTRHVSITSVHDDEPTLEEDSDGYNSAAHLEQLLTDQTSECAIDMSNALSLSEEQRPQFDESFEPSSSSRSERRARQLFDPRILGNDENEYDQTRFKSMVRRLIPDQVAIPDQCPLPRRRASPRVYNCGACHYVKLFIVVSLVVAIFVNTIFDPCFEVKWTGFREESQTSKFKPDGNGSTLEKAPRMTSSSHYLKLRATRRVRHRIEKKHPHDRNVEQSSSNSLDSATDRVLPKKKYCAFKRAYIIVLSVGLPVYLAIFLTYTCKLVVRFHDFGWFLLEAILLLVYSTLLLIFSICALFLSGHLVVNISVLVDALLGLIIASWTYRKYSRGADPFSLIIDSDADMYEITQILARRQITRLFVLGESQQHK